MSKFEQGAQAYAMRENGAQWAAVAQELGLGISQLSRPLRGTQGARMRHGLSSLASSQPATRFGAGALLTRSRLQRSSPR